MYADLRSRSSSRSWSGDGRFGSGWCRILCGASSRSRRQKDRGGGNSEERRAGSHLTREFWLAEIQARAPHLHNDVSTIRKLMLSQPGRDQWISTATTSQAAEAVRPSDPATVERRMPEQPNLGAPLQQRSLQQRAQGAMVARFTRGRREPLRSPVQGCSKKGAPISTCLAGGDEPHGHRLTRRTVVNGWSRIGRPAPG